MTEPTEGLDREEVMQKGARLGFPPVSLKLHGEHTCTVGGPDIMPLFIASSCACVLQQIDALYDAYMQNSNPLTLLPYQIGQVGYPPPRNIQN